MDDRYVKTAEQLLMELLAIPGPSCQEQAVMEFIAAPAAAGRGAGEAPSCSIRPITAARTAARSATWSAACRAPGRAAGGCSWPTSTPCRFAKGHGPSAAAAGSCRPTSTPGWGPTIARARPSCWPPRWRCSKRSCPTRRCVSSGRSKRNWGCLGRVTPGWACWASRGWPSISTAARSRRSRSGPPADIA